MGVEARQVLAQCAFAQCTPASIIRLIRLSYPRQAIALQERLLELGGRIESLRLGHEKLEEGNKPL